MSIRERYSLFLDLLTVLPPADSYEGARAQLARALEQVEGRRGSRHRAGDGWRFDGRLHAPLDEQQVPSSHQGVTTFRVRSHRTLIGDNGAIRIEHVARGVELDKAGADGASVG